MTESLQTDPAHLFFTMSHAVEYWASDQDQASQSENIRGDLRRHIRTYVATERSLPDADRVQFGTGQRDCDIVIDETVGIKIIFNLYSGSKEWIHKELRALLHEYDYLIVYGHNVSEEHMDLWRMMRRSVEQSATMSDRVACFETYQTDRHIVSLADVVWTNEFLSKALIVVMAFGLLTGILYLFETGIIADSDVLTYAGGIVVINLLAVSIGAFIYLYF